MANVAADLHARLSNSWVGKKGNDEEGVVPHWVDSIYEDDGDIYIRTNKELVKFNEDDWILDCPKVGMVSDGEKVYYQRRIPDRQWKRGYNRNVIRMSVLSQSEVEEMGLSITDYNDEKIVGFVFNQKFTPFTDGLREIAEGKLFSFPLSQKFAVGLRLEDEFPVVYYKNWVVGWVEDDVVRLPENAHHLFEELTQYAACRRV